MNRNLRYSHYLKFLLHHRRLLRNLKFLVLVFQVLMHFGPLLHHHPNLQTIQHLDRNLLGRHLRMKR
jgi:hypothetical protein